MARDNFKGVFPTYKNLKSTGERKRYWIHRATNIRLPDDRNSIEFLEAYLAAEQSIRNTDRNTGIFKGFIQNYLSSGTFDGLRVRTKKDYLKIIVI